MFNGDIVERLLGNQVHPPTPNEQFSMICQKRSNLAVPDFNADFLGGNREHLRKRFESVKTVFL
jgi:hypothetical protein